MDISCTQCSDFRNGSKLDKYGVADSHCYSAGGVQKKCNCSLNVNRIGISNYATGAVVYRTVVQQDVLKSCHS